MTLHLRRPLRRRASRRGNAMIEAALIVMIFFPILLGIFDFAQFLYVQQAIVERARSAIRWGAVNDPTDSTSIENMVLYDQAAAPANGTPPFFNLTAGTCSTCNVTAATAGTEGTDDYRLTLTIKNYYYSVISPYIFGQYEARDINLTVPLGRYE